MSVDTGPLAAASRSRRAAATTCPQSFRSGRHAEVCSHCGFAGPGSRVAERVPVPVGLTDRDLPLPTGSGPRSGWPLFSARRGRARPGASLRRGHRRLGPRRARGRVWRSLRDLAQAGPASLPAPWWFSPAPWWFSSLAGYPESSGPRSLRLLIATGWYRWALLAIIFGPPTRQEASNAIAVGVGVALRGPWRSVEQPFGLFEVPGGVVEVVVAALHPGFPPEEVAARLGL